MTTRCTTDIEITLTENDLILLLLQKKINDHLKRAASEQFYPGGDPDHMDNTIKGNLEQAVKYQKLRVELETVMSWALVRDV